MPFSYLAKSTTLTYFESLSTRSLYFPAALPAWHKTLPVCHCIFLHCLIMVHADSITNTNNYTSKKSCLLDFCLPVNSFLRQSWSVNLYTFWVLFSGMVEQWCGWYCLWINCGGEGGFADSNSLKKYDRSFFSYSTSIFKVKAFWICVMGTLPFFIRIRRLSLLI